MAIHCVAADRGVSRKKKVYGENLRLSRLTPVELRRKKERKQERKFISKA